MTWVLLSHLSASIAGVQPAVSYERLVQYHSVLHTFSAWLAMALTLEGSPHRTTVVIRVEGRDQFGTMLTSYRKDVARLLDTEGSGSTIQRPENSCTNHISNLRESI